MGAEVEIRLPAMGNALPIFGFSPPLYTSAQWSERCIRSVIPDAILLRTFAFVGSIPTADPSLEG